MATRHQNQASARRRRSRSIIIVREGQLSAAGPLIGGASDGVASVAWRGVAVRESQRNFFIENASQQEAPRHRLANQEHAGAENNGNRIEVRCAMK